MTQSRTMLIDARWIGIGGPGRVAENLLRGLGSLRPEGRWVVWGPDQIDDLLWPEATRLPSRHHPKAWYSQREFPGPRSVRADVAFYAHHLRPAWRLAPVEVTTIHDTIPFRYPPSAALAPLMRRYIARMAALSTVVVTDSEFSKRSLMADLGLASERIALLDLPIDHDSAARVRALRASTQRDRRVVFIGRDAPHKNLDRLVEGFGRSSFAASGGELSFVGLDGSAVERIGAVARAANVRLDLAGVVSQPELEARLAACAMVIQPSLEEGFGLPAAEAAAAGIPVAVSTGGSLPEIMRGSVEPFDPTDVDAIAAAIDRTVALSSGPDLDWATPEDLARSVVAAIDLALSLDGRGARR